jgi:hypothetical protein
MKSIKSFIILSLGDFLKFLKCHLHFPQYTLLIELIGITIKEDFVNLYPTLFLDDYK